MSPLYGVAIVLAGCAAGPSLYARDPGEVYRAAQRMAQAHRTERRDLPRLVELLDATEPHMAGECLRLVTEGDPLARGDLAEAEVNSYGARVATCRLRPWPSTAGFARQLLVAWPDRDALAAQLVARALAKPASVEELAGVARGSPVLASQLVAALGQLDSKDPRRLALLRLALEVDGGDAEALRAEPSLRAAVVIVRWTSARPASALRKLTIARVAANIVQPGVIADLTRIGAAAAAVLTREVRARLWVEAARSKWMMAGVVGAVAAAGVQIAPAERKQIARMYDRLCVEPDRKIEREMGELFTMWNGPDPDCDGVRTWLDRE